MNNLSSYCGLVDAKIRASDEDLFTCTKNVVYGHLTTNIFSIFKSFFYNLSFNENFAYFMGITNYFFLLPFSLLFNDHSNFLLKNFSIFSIKIPLFNKIFSFPLWFPDFSLFLYQKNRKRTLMRSAY